MEKTTKNITQTGWDLWYTLFELARRRGESYPLFLIYLGGLLLSLIAFFARSAALGVLSSIVMDMCLYDLYHRVEEMSTLPAAPHDSSYVDRDSSKYSQLPIRCGDSASYSGNHLTDHSIRFLCIREITSYTIYPNFDTSRSLATLPSTIGKPKIQTPIAIAY